MIYIFLQMMPYMRNPIAVALFQLKVLTIQTAMSLRVIILLEIWITILLHSL